MGCGNDRDFPETRQPGTAIFRFFAGEPPLEHIARIICRSVNPLRPSISKNMVKTDGSVVTTHLCTHSCQNAVKLKEYFGFGLGRTVMSGATDAAGNFAFDLCDRARRQTRRLKNEILLRLGQEGVF